MVFPRSLKSALGNAPRANDDPRNRLSQYKPPELDAAGADVGKIVVRLLGEPAFRATAKNLGQAHGHFRRNAALAVHELRQRSARDAQVLFDSAGK